jgi:hypothetical protein
METVLAAWAWVQANGVALSAAVGAVHFAAVAIVNLTPTPKDDAIVATVYKYVEFAAGLLTKRAKA